MYSADVDWPVVEVQAPINFNEGVEYGGQIQEVTEGEFDEEADGDEDELEWVEGAVDVTPRGDAFAPRVSGVGGFDQSGQHGGVGAVPTSPAQALGQ